MAHAVDEQSEDAEAGVSSDEVAPKVEHDYPGDNWSEGGFAAFARGLAAALWSPFGLPFLGLYLGFGALACDEGFSLVWAESVTALVFAVPAQILLVSGLNGQMGLLETAVAISLTAVRFAPMTATLIALVRRPDTRMRQMLAASHCVVVTVWVESMRLLPARPKAGRLAYLNGLAAAFFCFALVGTWIGHTLSTRLHPIGAAALLFMTPNLFLLAGIKGCRSTADWCAILVSLAACLLLWLVGMRFDPLWIGVAVGTLAFACQWMISWRRNGVR